MPVNEPLGIFWDMGVCSTFHLPLLPHMLNRKLLCPKRYWFIRTHTSHPSICSWFWNHCPIPRVHRQTTQMAWTPSPREEAPLRRICLENCPHAGRKNVVDDEIICRPNLILCWRASLTILSGHKTFHFQKHSTGSLYHRLNLRGWRRSRRLTTYARSWTHHCCVYYWRFEQYSAKRASPS